MRRLLFLNAQWLDVLTFLWAVSAFGMAGEGNPVMRDLYQAGGIGGVIAVRFLAVTAYARWVPRWRTAFTFGIWLGLVGASTNLAALALR